MTSDKREAMRTRQNVSRGHILPLITRRPSLFFGRAAREPEAEAAPLAGLGLDGECAAERLGQRERDGEAEAGAAARVFGGEERVEDAREGLGRDAGAGVGHLDAHALAVEQRDRKS